MRVTFNSTFIQSGADLARTAADLAKYQLEVSSGRRVNTASDDPTAAAGSVRERGEIAAIDHYTRATDSATSRLSVLDSVLSGIIVQLEDAGTAILSARGSVSETQRQAAADVLTGIRDALFNDFNTQVLGTFVFSGSSTTTAPYQRQPDGSISPYQGTATAVKVDVGRETAVETSYSGESIAKGTDVDDVFVELERAIAAVRAGDADGMQTAAEALNRAFSRATAAQSRTGLSLRTLEAQQGRLQDLRLAGDKRVAGYEQADLAEAITKMTQADTAHRAALGAVGASSQMSLMDYLR